MIDLLNPEPEDIRSLDIAHALSHLCRWTGHTSCFYSVAQHCILVSENVPIEHALSALLHDATEAYVGDMASPLKSIFPQYQHVETIVWHAIAERYGLPVVLDDSIKTADLLLQRTEARDLVGGPAVSRGRTLPAPIQPWSPEVAKARYLYRLHQLTKARAA